MDARVAISKFTEISVQGLFTLALIAAFWVGRDILIPIAIAIILTFALKPIVNTMVRARIARGLATVIVLLAFIAGLIALSTQLVGPAEKWATRLPASIRKIENQLTPIKSALSQVTKAAERIEDIAAVSSPQGEVVVQKFSILGAIMDEGRVILVRGLLVFTCLFFMLANGPQLTEQFTYFLEDEKGFQGAPDLLLEIEKSVTKYLSTITLTNFCLGALVSLGLYLVGFPNPLLWGAMAAVLNFIPYAGVMLGTLVLAIVGAVSFTDPVRVCSGPLVLYGLSIIEGNFVTPQVLGRSFDVNPIIVFLWLVFCALLWGIPGAFLAVPLLISGKVVLNKVRLQKVSVSKQELSSDVESSESVEPRDILLHS